MSGLPKNPAQGTHILELPKAAQLLATSASSVPMTPKLELAKRGLEPESKSFRFLDLPMELRFRVYNILEDVPDHSGSRSKHQLNAYGGFSETRKSLRLACRQNNQEFVPNFWRSTTVILDQNEHNPKAFVAFLKTQKPATVVNIRHSQYRLNLRDRNHNKIEAAYAKYDREDENNSVWDVDVRIDNDMKLATILRITNLMDCKLNLSTLEIVYARTADFYDGIAPPDAAYTGNPQLQALISSALPVINPLLAYRFPSDGMVFGGGVRQLMGPQMRYLRAARAQEFNLDDWTAKFIVRPLEARVWEYIESFVEQLIMHRPSVIREFNGSDGIRIFFRQDDAKLREVVQKAKQQLADSKTKNAGILQEKSED